MNLMTQAIPAVLILGFRLSAMLFLVLFPVVKSSCLLLTKPWIIDPLWQGIQHILLPLANLEKKDHTFFLSKSESSILLLANDATDVIIDIKEDINQATLATLSRVEGVGIKRAQEIIEYRASCNGFRRMEELSLIKGVGQKTFSVLCQRFEVSTT
jgi:competence ComEA-like helix-hairpin-helix protein